MSYNQKVLFPIQCYYINTRKYVTSYKHRKDRVGRAGQLEAKRGRQARKFGNHCVRGLITSEEYRFMSDQ